jgi:hypothetical protein
VRILNDNIFWSNTAHIEFDEDGWGMILSSVDYTPPAPSYEAVLLNTSHDDGVTWSPPDTLTPVRSALAYNEDIVRQGHLWLAYWWDTAHQAGFDRGGVWCRFSANRGRSWYPNQQVEGIGWSGGAVGHGEINGNRTHVSAFCYELDNAGGNYFLEWEGQLRIDSLPPVIGRVTVLPELVPVDTTVAFCAVASDNDSLWRIEVVVHRRWEALDSTVITLERIPDGSFVGEWQVPVDTAQYVYYYRAEDMWENVSYSPAAGPADPYVVHVGAITAVDPFIVHPSSFILSVFPNPVNSVAVIELQLPSFGAEAQVELFDLLGRRVYENTIRNVSGSRRLFLDVSSWSSGLYFVKASCGARQVHEKVLVLK